MDTAWLTSWLTELNLPEYIDTFGNAGYNTPELCATIGDKEKLKSIGVSKVGHLNRLLRAVEKLGSELNGEKVASVPEDTIPPTESVNCETQTSKAQTFAQSKSVSLSMEGVTKKPPPVPQRKSMRRSTTSPIDRTQSPSTETPSCLAPPPVLPRQQSLKVKSATCERKPPVAARRGVQTIARGDESKHFDLSSPTSDVLSLTSPVTPAERKLPISTMPPTTAETNGPSPASSTTPSPSITPEPLKLFPQPKPRPKPRLHSPDVNATRKVLADTNVSPDERASPVNGPVVTPHPQNVAENSLPEEPQKVNSPPPPPIPVKKASCGKRVIIPDEDVVFELEDVPMPETPRDTNIQPLQPIPVLPPKEEDTPPSHTPAAPLPALPLKEEEHVPPSVHSSTLPSAVGPGQFSEESGQTVVPPLLPPKEEVVVSSTPSAVPPLPSKEHLQPEAPPPVTTTQPPPTRRHFVTDNECVDSQNQIRTPPLPRKDTGPPSFSPPPPSEPKEEARMPPLPLPRTTSTLPVTQRTTLEVCDDESPPPTLTPELPSLSPDHPLPEDMAESPVHKETPPAYLGGLAQSKWNDDDDDIIPIGDLNSLSAEPAICESEEQDLAPKLPPKEEQPLPPPPPPITPEDYPEDYSESDITDSEEESGPLMSIQSSKALDDDRMMVAQTPHTNGVAVYSDDEGTTPSTSAEGTPKKKTLIRQSGPSLERGFTNQDIMIMSPRPPADLEGDDYMNQEAIDQANIVDTDYMNQDAIDQSLADEDDVNATNMERQHFTIRGSAPIKSRTLEHKNNDDGMDYENQNIVDEVLQGDIIPVGTISFDEPISVPEATGRDYSYSVPPPVSSSPPQPRVVKHKYEELDVDFNARDPPHPRSATVSVGGQHSTFEGGRVSPNLLITTAPTVGISGSTGTSTRDDGREFVPLRTTEERPERESSLEASGGSLNLTFPRTTSTSSSSLYKPPLPRPQEAPPSYDDVIQRSQSVDDTVDGDCLTSLPTLPTHAGYYEASRLPRAAGTFAGVESGYKRPIFNRYQSDNAFSRRDEFAQSAMFYPGATRKDSAHLKHVPKTKEGFLHKKGGVHGDKPWQRRWVTFNGTELKYFKNQSDKDKSSRNIIPLAEMIDIKKVPDDDKQNRFDLVVINRVFQFHADSLEDSQVWISVLHAAISRFKPQEAKEGGIMSDPDRQGVLQKQGHGPFAKFKERYVALKGSKFAYYLSKEDFIHGRPIHILEMTLSSVRPDMVAKLPRFVITMNNQKQYVFQAGDELERKEWMDILTSAILTGLDTREQTLTRVVKQTKSTEILQQIQENPSNKTCADCAATDPVWGVINLGIMVCINCSGVHRSMGTHISKVRSVELDHQIWKPTLIQLMNTIGNERSNSFWERHSQRRDRLPADVERDIRENFIRAKYQVKSWIPTPTGESQETLNKLICVAVKNDNLMRTVELLTLGADVCHVVNDPSEPDVTCALDIAKKYDQTLQVELLEQNGALVCKRPEVQETLTIGKKGFLYKTGSDRAGWKKRYCSLDKFRGFQYYKSETDTDLLGHIHMEEMMSVARCEDELSRDPKYQHCFEVNTQGRGYLFCADSEADMEEWIKVFEQIIDTSDAAENLGYDKVGYLKKKDPHNVGGWKRRWFTLKGKSLAYYKREREEVDEIDLRKVTDLKGPDSSGTYEQQCSIQVVLPERTYYLKAENPAEAESWMSALRHTQVSGIPLSEQQLTSTGIPILIHKCLQFVESYGMETEGLYRLSGEKVKIRKLILAFNQDARGVVIDPEIFTVHDVTGTLKLFFRSLPDPLLTHQLYHSFIATMQSDHESLLYQLQSLIEQMPLVNKDTLKRIIGHLRKVAEYESKNKMGVSNLVSLFGPTMMTVDGDPITFANTQFECNCISTMIKYYKWLFQVDEEEEKKEEAIEKGLQKIKEAEQMQQRIASISSNLGFLTTIYIGSKEGDSFNTNITGQTTVGAVVEDVATRKALPKTNYALYLVLGDSESHRVLSFSEKLLAAQCSAGTDCFLCLKPNTFADTLSQYFNTLGEGMPVTLHVREKKKWRKYPCTVRNSHFIQFKDVKCHNEFFKVNVNDLDIFAGIERNRIDVKNPMPTRYCFWLKTMRGEENCKYLCADSEADMLKLIAAVVQAKYPDQLQTPVLPVKPPPETLSPPLGTDRRPSPEEERGDLSVYANVKLSGRTR